MAMFMQESGTPSLRSWEVFIGSIDESSAAGSRRLKSYRQCDHHAHHQLGPPGSGTVNDRTPARSNRFAEKVAGGWPGLTRSEAKPRRVKSQEHASRVATDDLSETLPGLPA